MDRLAVGASYIDGLGTAIIAVFDGEFNLFAIGQGAEALREDGCLMDKEVFGAIVGGDEAEALGDVEPLDLTSLLGHSRGAEGARGGMARVKCKHEM